MTVIRPERSAAADDSTENPINEQPAEALRVRIKPAENLGPDGRASVESGAPTLATIRERLREAIEEDHYCDEVDEHDRGCCIAAALRGGFVFVAARMLTGAIEAPHVDAVMNRYRTTETERVRWEQEYLAEDAAWLDYFDRHAVVCEACTAATYDADADGCAHCGADLPIAADSDED